MLWNEPNNKSHWAFEEDPDWAAFAEMTILASRAIAAENPDLVRVLGGISPIDPCSSGTWPARVSWTSSTRSRCMASRSTGTTGRSTSGPSKLKEIQAVTDLPVWVSEVGISTFGAEEVQVFGLKRTAELLIGRAPRLHWYSLYDLPRAWPATTRHKEAEGSSYYRHFYMGLLREDGSPKLALPHFSEFAPELGICQWFHFEDHRLDDAVRWLRELGVRHLRTGLSWADFYRPNALAWFDRQMAALEEFQVTVTFCFTPEHKGVIPHYTSPPVEPAEFADFCAAMVRRYAPGGTVHRDRPATAGVLHRA